ncbi:MAG: hypothetical protein NZM00_13695 [Anaerolinea sp.]|nr:hypothetical protein [Anaerolinea sp.]
MTTEQPSLSPYVGTLAGFSFVHHVKDQKLVLHSRSTMLALSYVIEQAAADHPGTRLIAAFQRLGLYRPQAERFHWLASRCPQVFVLGFPDVRLTMPSGVTFVPLEATWPLIHEWVVIAWGPACTAALVAYDVERRAPEQRSRYFHGLWTTRSEVIDAVVAAFYAALQQPAPVFHRDTRATYRANVSIQKALQARLRAMG